MFQLELFKKWDNELQERKAELERNIEALSPASKNALEEWRAIRQEVRITIVESIIKKLY